MSTQSLRTSTDSLVFRKFLFMKIKKMQRKVRAFVFLKVEPRTTPNSRRIANFIIHKISSVKGVQDTQTIIPTHSKIKLPE